MEKKGLLNTREVAELLDINEKVVYSLINEKGLPATKVTGKWLFSRHLVEQWLENATVNYPKPTNPLPPYHGLLIISGSNDVLLDKTLSLFNTQHPNHMAVFGNTGSMEGIKALRRNLCHMATSHLLQEDEQDYNFGFASEELEQMPAIVNFCRREQGIITTKGNPKGIESIADLAKPGITLVNRPMGTGTRLLLDNEMTKAEVKGDRIAGYHNEVPRHLDVGLEVLAGRADAGPGIRVVAEQLDLDFIPLRWERFDLVILKDHFFEQGVQLFLGLLHNQAFKDLGHHMGGYDLTHTGEMVFPEETTH
jgi:excisionase family DNA binding protein